MRYKLLGRSGLRVSELCLGTMTFGEDWGWGASEEESRRVFDAYVEAGGNFIDTACNYTNGTSERFVGRFTAPRRDRFVIATKYSLTQRADDPNGGGNSRKNLVQTLEDSLERLGTDYVDMLYVHMWDFSTPVDEVMRGLDDVIRAGKVRYAAVSDTPSWIVSRANTMADLRGGSPFVALQLPYSLLRRDAERSEIPMADTLDLAILPWGVLGAGVLTGKYNDAANRPTGTRLSEGKWGPGALSDRNLEIAAVVTKVAEEVGRSSSQVALNWVRQRDGGVTIPIIAATKLAQIQDNIASVDFELSDEHMARLSEASAFERGFPLDFLDGETVQNLVHGETREHLLMHRRSG